ncbi:hypothetical protein FB45DRAFT_1020058 [Roridomyces roridus]|uniref:Uncharacterized protein n=1 Tax=Roridomyces roridus TaxID=1738132 RepID=A0AAD7CG87_9AGAR|nr:hypothetical protein FB45DRAFT_1020058 [Roridomyces roridus]
MRTVRTPPRRKDTPVFDKQSQESNATQEFDIDDSQDDGYTLSARGDISLSRPYYIPGAPGALSPPGSQRGTPESEGVRRRPVRARPPMRRLIYSEDSKTEHQELMPPVRPPSVVLGRTSTIVTIPDEEDVSTPHSRFMTFMTSRDLTHSPKKNEAPPRHPLDELAQDKEDALERETASRPLRGNARLPPRLPIPNWDSMNVDSSF